MVFALASLMVAGVIVALGAVVRFRRQRPVPDSLLPDDDTDRPAGAGDNRRADAAP